MFLVWKPRYKRKNSTKAKKSAPSAPKSIKIKVSKISEIVPKKNNGTRNEKSVAPGLMPSSIAKTTSEILDVEQSIFPVHPLKQLRSNCNSLEFGHGDAHVHAGSEKERCLGRSALRRTICFLTSTKLDPS